MSNFVKRVASMVMGEEDGDGLGAGPAKKFCVAQASQVLIEESKEVKGQHEQFELSKVNDGHDQIDGKAVDLNEKEEDKKEKEEDDDLFEDLNEPTNRVICKVSELKIGVVYQLVDIYSLQVEDRLAVVGGFKVENEDVMYVWMPTSLVRNYDAKKVNELKAKIEKGKKGYAVYKGMKQSKYGTPSYDMVWVQKSKN